MAEFLMIALFAFMGAVMFAPVTGALLGAAFLLAWSGRKNESPGAGESGRFRCWCCIQAMPSLLIVIGGAIAARHRGVLQDELAIWLLVCLLSQLFLAAIGCWWCQSRWRSTLSAALALGAYSIGASVVSIFSSISHL
ncbi:hypothetical protein Pan44_12540 [Caulifigura coniformis]|uniref:Uncharacterized protein n=1 Tax=Caulifigura coniformis TaxID=2527983 RepID=A0A517SAT4_9PLAN|nr:hypothetical protein [Caulifigura coniformis]QDT53238.1 hypothetical protein Pan44_12540 [Caulifigura coniformis]